MKDRTTELESALRQIHADQGGEADFAKFVHSTADDSTKQGHREAREYIGGLASWDESLFEETGEQDKGQQEFYARNAQVDDLIRLPGQGQAVFKVTGRTLIDPPDNVEVELVSDPLSEAHFQSGDVPGSEWVCLVRSEPGQVH